MGKRNVEAADVLVRVRPSSSSSSCNQSSFLVLPLHSRVLCARSEFFAARLSQRWHSAHHLSLTNSVQDFSNHEHIGFGNCNDLHHAELGNHDALMPNHHLNPADLPSIDITAPDLSTVDTYKQCIELMYVPHTVMNVCRPFSGVHDALSMLHVAAELLFHDCIDACMQFLEMLPSWTPSEEASIRSSLSSLQLPHIHPDLASRLSLPQSVPSDRPMLILRGMLVHVLCLACKGLPTPVPALKTIDPSKPIPESTILLAWNALLNLIKSKLKKQDDVNSIGSTVKWLFNKLLALRAADAVVKAFAKETELSSLTTELLKCTYGNVIQLANPVLSILQCVMRAMQDGQVLLSRSFRCILLTTWLPVGQAMKSSSACSYPDVIIGFQNLVNSLPLVDREQFFKGCMDPVLNERPLSLLFGPWCDMLRQAHLQLWEGQETSVVINDAC